MLYYFRLKIHKTKHRKLKNSKAGQKKRMSKYASAFIPDKDFPVNLLFMYPECVFTQFLSCMFFKKALPRVYELCNHVTNRATQT